MVRNVITIFFNKLWWIVNIDGIRLASESFEWYIHNATGMKSILCRINAVLCRILSVLYKVGDIRGSFLSARYQGLSFVNHF